MSILRACDFDPTAIKFSAVEKNRMGGRMVHLQMPGADKRGRIVLQTPVMALPFGAQPYQDPNTGDVMSWSTDVSFRDNDPKVVQFMETIKVLDEVMLKAAHENSAEWFGKKMAPEVLGEFYRKLVKPSNNPLFAPTMKLKIPLVNGEISTQVFDESKAPKTMDYVTKGTSCRLIIELGSIWFINKSFGVSWKVLQMAVVSRPRRMETFAFVDDDDAEDATAAGGSAFLDDDKDDMVTDANTGAGEGGGEEL